MSCYICGKTHTDKQCPPGYTTTTTTEDPTLCPPAPACEDLYNSHCIYYSGINLSCAGIYTGDTVNTIIANLLTQLESCCLPTTTTSTTTSTTTTSTTTTSTTTTTTTCQIHYLICCSSYNAETLQIIEAPCNIKGLTFLPWETYADITNSEIGGGTYIWVVATYADLVSLGYSGANISYVPDWNSMLWASTGGSSVIDTLSTCNNTIKPPSTCPETIIPTTTTSTTSTSTTTTINQECDCFTVTNLETTSGIVAYKFTYTECFVNTIATVYLDFGQSTSICAQPNTISTNFGASIYDNGTCGEQCPPTTTTTTLPPCKCYNVVGVDAFFDYLDCNDILQFGYVNGDINICALENSISSEFGLFIVDLGACTEGCLTTTTTTIVPPPCVCYTITNPGAGDAPAYSFTYIDCEGVGHTGGLGAGQSTNVCALEESISTLCTVIDNGPCETNCPPTTTTTSTTTTTTLSPICDCYTINNVETESGIVTYEFTYNDCDTGLVVTTPLDFGESASFCAKFGTVNANFAATFTNFGVCGLDCPPTTTTTTAAPTTTTTSTTTTTTTTSSTTTTTTLSPVLCYCYTVENTDLVFSNNVSYTVCGTAEELYEIVLPGATINLCAAVGTPTGNASIVITGGTVPCTTDGDCAP